MTGEDLLSTLKPYFTDGLSVNDIDKVSVLHDIFEKDFFTDGVTIDGEKLKVKPYKYHGSNKDRLPVDEATRTGFLLIMSHFMRNLFILSLEA